MKKVTLLLALLFSVNFALAACELDVSLLNQDPYPAAPNEYVKLVFQIEGIDSTDCGDITFILSENYPIEFNPGENGIRTFKQVDYIKDYQSTIQVPYEIRINENALDGASSIEVAVKNKNSVSLSKTLSLEVQNTVADFEVYITDYDYISKELTVEILNIGSSDIEALTIEVPKQDGVSIKGTNRIVAGDLDSNEYTSVDFEATPNDGDIILNIYYSDAINVRRMIEKTIEFDSSYFIDRSSDQKSSGNGGYIALGVLALIIVWIIIKKIKKAKRKKRK